MPCALARARRASLILLASQGAHLNIPLTRYLIPTAALLTFASQSVAQNSEPATQGLSNSGSSISNLLRNARYDFGRGLTFTSQDGEASMNIGGQLQAGYNWTEDDNGTTNSNWSVASSRLRVGGQVMEGLTYFMQFDPQGGGQGNGNLVDGWVGYQATDAIHLRLGQQKMRSGLSADTSANDTDFETVSRSIATNEFANARATGALFTGHAMEGKFNWHAGVMNNGTAASQLTQQNNDGTDMSFTVGASFGSGGNSEDWSEGDLARSGNMSWLAGVTLTQDNAVADDFMTINAYGGFKFGNGLAAQVELWSRDADNASTTDTGFYVQGSYTLEKSGSWQPGLVARFSTLDQESAGDEETTEVLVGANAYYAAHNLKTQVQVRQVSQDLADTDLTSFDVLFTLVF